MEALSGLIGDLDEQEEKKGLPSYLTAIPVMGGPPSGSWAIPSSDSPTTVSDAQQRLLASPPASNYHLMFSAPWKPSSPASPGYSKPPKVVAKSSAAIADTEPTNGDLSQPDVGLASLAAATVNMTPKSPVGPPPASKLELDFGSLLQDLQETHDQLVSAHSPRASDLAGNSSESHMQGSEGRAGAGTQNSAMNGNAGSFNDANGNWRPDLRKVSYEDGVDSQNAVFSAPSSVGGGNGTESRYHRSTRFDSASDDDDEDAGNEHGGGGDGQSVSNSSDASDRLSERKRPLAPSPREDEEEEEDGSISDESESDFGPNTHDSRSGGWTRNRRFDDEDVELESEGDEEIEIPADDNDVGGAPAAVERGLGAPGPALQNVTLEDYEDVDGLMDVLDRYIKKSRYSRMLQGRDVAGHRVEPLAARFVQQPSPLKKPIAEHDEPEDDMPLYKLHTLQRGKKKPEPEPVPSPEPDRDKMNVILSKLNEANLKKITTRIYIEDAQTFVTLVLTSLMSADNVIADMIGKHKVEPSPHWTLFELANDLGIERPLRDWEVVTDVIASWDANASVNAILMKKYGYRSTIIPSVGVGSDAVLLTFLVAGNRRKVSKDSRVYIPRNEAEKVAKALLCVKRGVPDVLQGVKGETLLCRLSGFDVYTLSRVQGRTPTQFCFALRSTSNVSIFENKSDYVKFICVEKQERLYDWVLAIRLAKNELTFQDFPELFDDYDDIPARTKPNDEKTLTPTAPPTTTTMKRKQTVKESNPFVAPTNTLLGRKDRPVKAVEERPAEQPPEPTSGVKPLLSFPSSKVNYQQREKQLPAASPSTRHRKHRPPEPAKAQPSAPQEGERTEQLRGEDMDDRWEKEQAEVLRLIEEERKKVLSGESSSSLTPAPSSSGPDPRRVRRKDGDGGGEQRQRDATAEQDAARRARRRKEEAARQKDAGRHASQQEARDKGDQPRLATLGRTRGKPLIELGDVKNCLSCGCSEFKAHKVCRLCSLVLQFLTHFYCRPK
ncbi:hypothetical protein HK101_010609 [Irineochytrium annulatum]|nr:hypothetical protein HK101_010609 [Irineochytrium annulatum]